MQMECFVDLPSILASAAKLDIYDSLQMIIFPVSHYLGGIGLGHNASTAFDSFLKITLILVRVAP